MNKKSEVNIKGNDNTVNQIEKQVNFYVFNSSSEYLPDEYASKLLKETIEDEQNPTIIYVRTLSGRTIQCGSARFSVGSSSKTEREMLYWEDALKKLEDNDYIYDVGYKGEVFKITKKGYDYYNEYIKEIVEM